MDSPQENSPEIGKNKRTIKSFVKREGRLTEGQKRILEQSPYFISQQNIPTISLKALAASSEPCQVIDHKINTSLENSCFWDLDQIFGRKNQQRTLEIGFGNGTSLVEMAENAPDRDFLGVEVHRPGVGHLLLGVEAKGLCNIRANDTDVIVLLRDHLPKNSFDCVQIFFPDPWHKKRHHKRRLIQTDFLEKIWPILTQDGIIHCATDWEAYAIHILAVLSASPLFENVYTSYAPRPENRPLTKFEKRGQNLGHGVWDLMFRKIN